MVVVGLGLLVIISPSVLRYCVEASLISYGGSLGNKKAIGFNLKLLSVVSSQEYLESRAAVFAGPDDKPIWAISLGLKGEKGMQYLQRIANDTQGNARIQALVGIGWSEPAMLRAYLEQYEGDVRRWRETVGAVRVLEAKEYIPLIESQLKTHPELQDGLVEAWLNEIGGSGRRR
ncbi:MAG TPA: hypothetical protein VHP11_11220 [Tepidisphaeraceae bacterium]|nr:hypothetical protein [Tepidisphaeraceae bacterium]